MGLFTKLFGTRSEREVKKLEPQVEAVMALEEPYKKLTDQELRAKTQEFKDRYASGETLDALLPEAFAVCREAADRVLGMRPYRVQVVGGIVLHQGRIAEMKTGEGKTLVATLPAYLNALSGKGVHVVTVNDYLARRDSEWMGKVYRYLGLSVGLIVHDLDNNARKAAYNADITYGTNNELGFDYLRDNMVIYKENKVQRGHNFAIVDEVDSILIDEARTPLIISGIGQKSTEMYSRTEALVARFRDSIGGRWLFFNPRRREFHASPAEMEYQVAWELAHLEAADLIVMNLLGDSRSPISLLEMGLYARSGKLFVACSPDYYRYDNVRITCRRYGVPLYDSLTALLDDLPQQSDE